MNELHNVKYVIWRLRVQLECLRRVGAEVDSTESRGVVGHLKVLDHGSHELEHLREALVPDGSRRVNGKDDVVALRAACDVIETVDSEVLVIMNSLL